MGTHRERLEEVALQVLADRERLYSELADRARRRDVETFHHGEDSESIQVEVQYFFDSGASGPVRIMVAVDDEGWRSFVPLVRDTLVSG